jgi:signal transduction histidine kinase
MSEENLSQIFDPYLTSKPNGFGLGLASALNIIRSHKASLDVQSTDGLGATFILLFEKA